jgi:hypothetical protein
LRHFNRPLLLFKRERLIDLEAVKIEIEERLVFGVGPIEVGSIFLVLLKFCDLSFLDIFSAMNHHLR